MTTETETPKETKKAKKPVDRYIFEGVEGSKQNKIVGRIYFHKKGSGMNILMNGKTYSAFAPKAKQPEAAPTEQPAAQEGA